MSKAIRGQSQGAILGDFCDMDPGVPFDISDKERKKILRLYKKSDPSGKKVKAGKLIMFGTGGEITGGRSFREMFDKQPEKPKE